MLTPQGALPDHQHPPALLRQAGSVAAVAADVGVDFIEPELAAGGGESEQVAVVAVPEAAVGEDNAAVLRQHEVRTARQGGVLDGIVKAGLPQQPGEPLFNGGIPGADGAHILAARGGIMDVRHRPAPPCAAPPPAGCAISAASPRRRKRAPPPSCRTGGRPGYRRPECGTGSPAALRSPSAGRTRAASGGGGGGAGCRGRQSAVRQAPGPSRDRPGSPPRPCYL